MKSVVFRSWTTIMIPVVSLLMHLAGCTTSRYYMDTRYKKQAAIPSLPDRGAIQRLFLIGDAGDPDLDRQESVLAILEKDLSIEPEKNVVIFLGDNVYYNGLPSKGDTDRPFYEKRLDEQVRIVERSGARGIFIPGNHDWSQGSDDGWDRVRYQSEYISERRNSRITFLPRDGCPGPEIVNIGGHLRLIVLDTQWWLHEGPKPEGESSPCAEKTEHDVLEALSSAIRTAGGRRIVVAAHHPLETHGQHGGFFDWRDHIFPLRGLAPWLWIPLPGIGSLYPLARNMGISNQDLSSSRYRHMIRTLDSVLALYPPLAYVAGHEHVLQVLKRSGQQYYDLVSGCGTSVHDPTLTTGDATLFADPVPGYMRLDLVGTTAILHVIEPDERGEPVEVFRMRLDI